jgi:hypothetical protein
VQLAYLQDSRLGIDFVDGQKVLSIGDSFPDAYYSEDGREFFVYRPIPMRLFALGEHGWEIDRPGQFAAHYQALLEAEKQNYKPTGKAEDAAPVITMAYYLRMAGNSLEQAQALLVSLLPAVWKPYADDILLDIAVMTEAYNPVHNVASGSKCPGKSDWDGHPTWGEKSMLRKYGHLFKNLYRFEPKPGQQP